MIKTEDFPVTVELLYTIEDRKTWFWAGRRFTAVGYVMKVLNVEAYKLKNKHAIDKELVSFWVIEYENKTYEFPVVACALVQDKKDPAKQYRLKYIIDSSEGPLGIRDHVKAAKDYLGVDISAHGIDWNHQYAKMGMNVTQTQILPKVIENLEEQISAPIDIREEKANIRPKLSVNIVSGVLGRGQQLSYGVYLNVEPTSEITVVIESDSMLLRIIPVIMVFRKDNYNHAQDVTIDIEPASALIENETIASVTHVCTGGNYEKVQAEKVSILIKKDK